MEIHITAFSSTFFLPRIIF